MCTVRAGGKGNSEEALSRKAAPTPSPCACPDALQRLLGLPEIVTATRWGGVWSTVWHLPALAQGHGLGGPAACPGWQKGGGAVISGPPRPLERGPPPLPAALRTWILELPPPALCSWVFPRPPQAPLGFSPSPHAFLGGVPAGTPGAAPLLPSVAPSRRVSAPRRAAESPQAPARRRQPRVPRGERMLGARERAESSFPFVLGVLAYLLAFPRQGCLGSTLHTYLGYGFAWEPWPVLRGPRRPSQKLLHCGGSYCTAQMKFTKTFCLRLRCSFEIKCLLIKSCGQFNSKLHTFLYLWPGTLQTMQSPI